MKGAYGNPTRVFKGHSIALDELVLPKVLVLIFNETILIFKF
jgi:hypothetical protein